MKSLKDLNKLTIDKLDIPEYCRCSSCGWEGKVADCIVEWESEGWEYPEYKIYYCPNCDDSDIDDYWPSFLQKYENLKQKVDKLLKYARHKKGCDKERIIASGSPIKCTCGYEKALKEYQGGKNVAS